MEFLQAMEKLVKEKFPNIYTIVSPMVREDYILMVPFPGWEVSIYEDRMTIESYDEELYNVKA